MLILKNTGWKAIIAALVLGMLYGHSAVIAADTAERFDKLKGQIHNNINLNLLNSAIPESAGDRLSQQEAEKMVNIITENIQDALKPYTKEIQIPGGTYRVINFEALEATTPDQLKTMYTTWITNLGKAEIRPGPPETEALIKKYPHLIKNAVGDIAAQMVMFDSAAREKLSQLFINWFNTIQHEVGELLNVFKTQGPAIMENPRALVEHVERIKAKARQYEHAAAPYLALWHIIVQDIFGEKTYTILFDQLPNSEAIKAAYNQALQTFNIKETFGKLLAELPPQGQEMFGKFLSNDLAVWALIGILFLPEALQKAFIDEPLRAHEEQQKAWKAQMEQSHKEYEEYATLLEKRRGEFKKRVAQDTSLEENDFLHVFDFDTNQVDEDKLKNRVAERKAWLAKTPGSVQEDFNTIQTWLDEEALSKYLSDRKAWLAKNPNKQPGDYFEVWFEDRNAKARRAKATSK